MRARDRDLVAGFLAVIAMLLGAVAWTNGRIDPGIELGVQDGPGQGQTRIVITHVEQSGPAGNVGLEPGMIVTSLNWRDVTVLPGWDLSRAATPSFNDDGTVGSPIPYLPDPTPTVVPPGPSEVDALVHQQITEIAAVRPEVLTRLLDPQEFRTYALEEAGWSGIVDAGGIAWVLGVAILLGGGWWLVTGRAGASIRGLAIPAVVATATPLLLFPFRAIGGPVPYAASSVIASLALLPLADGLIARFPVRTHRLAGEAAAVALAGGAAILGGLIGFMTDYPNRSVAVWWFAAAAVTVVPGILAARPTPTDVDGSPSTPSRRLLDSTEFAVLGLTPAIAFITFLQARDGPFIEPILLWIVAILLAGRFTIRPLARLATRAQLQRDLVVATMEAERSRIATNIHDDALQDVTLIVRRFDDAGDAEGADLARGVADRLRTISGDLRLPILDDLGVGPALDWLVSRMERIAGGEVRLELADGTRPPASVELAVFRIAQEALANAVKHGRPPIVVRYRAVESGVSLSIDDAGPGIAAGAAEEAPAAGHFGILGMSQRAEQIGAILDVRRWPTGGTHVALEWRPR